MSRLTLSPMLGSAGSIPTASAIRVTIAIDSTAFSEHGIPRIGEMRQLCRGAESIRREVPAAYKADFGSIRRVAGFIKKVEPADD